MQPTRRDLLRATLGIGAAAATGAAWAEALREPTPFQTIGPFYPMTRPLDADARAKESYLPDNIYTAIANFRASEHTAALLGGEVRDKFAELKEASADRCPRLLGSHITRAELQFHHAVTNHHLRSRF